MLQEDPINSLLKDLDMPWWARSMNYLTGYLFFRTRFGYPNSMRSRGPYGKRLRRDSSFMSPGNYKIKMIFEYISFLFKITLFTGGQLC